MSKTLKSFIVAYNSMVEYQLDKLKVKGSNPFKHIGNSNQCSKAKTVRLNLTSSFFCISILLFICDNPAYFIYINA